jgi:hypothetical protein
LERRNKLYTSSGSLGDDERLLDPATEPARVRAMLSSVSRSPCRTVCPSRPVAMERAAVRLDNAP